MVDGSSVSSVTLTLHLLRASLLGSSGYHLQTAILPQRGRIIFQGFVYNNYYGRT